MPDPIPSFIKRVDKHRMSEDLFYLAKHPLPCRTLNVTLPGHDKCTLYEADDYIAGKLSSWRYAVEREAVRVQAFRRDASKPLAHQYSRPEPSDPGYDAYNVYARKIGSAFPKEVIVVIAHKDSQSWLNPGPGAGDNAAGAVGAMEIARILSDCESRRSLWFVFCNEEHTPWTSRTAAQNLADSDMDVVAVLNIDSIGSKSQADRDAGRMVNVTRYTTPEGEALAHRIATLNERYGIGLVQSKYDNGRPANDDGSFITAGIPAAVHNSGSAPNANPYYHTQDDTPETVDMENVRLAVQLSLAAVVHLDINGR